jgi:hypothetical protein
MSKCKVGDTVVITALPSALNAFQCSDIIRAGRSFVIRRINDRGRFQLSNIDGSTFFQAWVIPNMVELVIPKVTQVMPKVPKVPKVKVKPKVPSAFYTHYSIQAKRNITREYLGLPRCAGGGIKKGVLIPLFAKYGVAVKSPRRASQLLTNTTGWLWQLNNGGWDVSNAVAFKRTVEIAGVL